MPPELSDLLREAKTDAPPPRYDVDDVVAAGKRRQRRRTTGWALAAVAAAVVAIGVPQMATRAVGRTTPAPPAATAPTPGPSAVAATRAFDYVFHGYTAAGYRVLDPEGVDIGKLGTEVRKVGNGDPDHSDALLDVYLPGVDPSTEFIDATRAETAPINGHPAFFVRPHGKTDPGAPPEQLVWQYSDTGFARLIPTESAIPRQVQRAIAEGFTLSAARAATVPLRAAYVPAGYVLVSVGDRGVTFEPKKVALRRLGPPAHDLLSTTDLNRPALSIGYVVPGSGRGAGLDGVTCVERGSVVTCVASVDEDRYRLSVTGRAGLSEAELRRVVAGVAVADPADRSTWTPATSAFPESAQLPRG
jgi:hypothetical protein